MPDGRLLAFYYVHGKDAAGKAVSENRLMELRPDGTSGPEIRVPLKHPFREYFTATVRAGSPPSDNPGRAGTSRRGGEHRELRTDQIMVNILTIP